MQTFFHVHRTPPVCRLVLHTHIKHAQSASRRHTPLTEMCSDFDSDFCIIFLGVHYPCCNCPRCPPHRCTHAVHTRKRGPPACHSGVHVRVYRLQMAFRGIQNRTQRAGQPHERLGVHQLPPVRLGSAADAVLSMQLKVIHGDPYAPPTGAPISILTFALSSLGMVSPSVTSPGAPRGVAHTRHAPEKGVLPHDRQGRM